jgi:hypothetical protein
MDYFLLVRGTDSVLADIREEARELGGETKKERRLIERLQHRTADLEDVGDQIRNMLIELPSLERSEELAESRHLFAVDSVHRSRRAG